MAIVNKPVFQCDNCGKQFEKPEVIVEDVPHEGASIVIIGKKRYEFYEGHFCSLHCFLTNILHVFNPDSRLTITTDGKGHKKGHKKKDK